MRTVNLAYIILLYNYLFGIRDEELENEFDINDPVDRLAFFSEAAKYFSRKLPYTQKSILDALEYVLSVPDINTHWRQIIPHDLPIEILTDKREYVRSLFQAVAGREAREDVDTANVLLKYKLDPEWYLN